MSGELPSVPDHIRAFYDSPENVKMNVSRFHGPNQFVESGPPRGTVTHGFDLAAKQDSDWQVMQLRWVEERGEWIAIAYKHESWGFDDEEEFYRGPFTLDDYCADRIKQVYNIPNERLDTSRITITSPPDLEKLSA